jgi:hypothetical protein
MYEQYEAAEANERVRREYPTQVLVPILMKNLK